MSEVVKQDFIFEWDGKTGYIKPQVSFDSIYDQAYWDKYVKYEKTDLGRKLDYKRVKFLCENIDRKISDYSILDVGIGSGSFLKWLNSNEDVKRIYGHDINKIAKEWLVNHKMFLSDETEIDIMTFWDSLEHIPNPTDFITAYKPKYVFMSLPIFRDYKHIINSKHFRPHEHIWYFTEEGLLDLFEDIGYEIYSRNKFEIELGREDIYSYCFIKKENSR